jgi:hypothetical protein
MRKHSLTHKQTTHKNFCTTLHSLRIEDVNDVEAVTLRVRNPHTEINMYVLRNMLTFPLTVDIWEGVTNGKVRKRP